jgi:DNA-binding GntR family transcriptional regulator
MLKRESLSDKLAEIIGTKIIHNELQAGEMIYETQISKEWGVSRSPVRDALHMLEQKRLVERAPKGSYRVTEFSPESIQNYYETIDILFQYAFAKTAQNPSEETLGILHSALIKMEENSSVKNIECYLEAVDQFARAILRGSGNPIVEQMALELMSVGHRIQWVSLTNVPENYKMIVKCVRQSYENITNKNPGEAARAFAEFSLIHIKAAVDSLEMKS